MKNLLLLLLLISLLFIFGGNTYAIHKTAPAETQKTEQESEIVQPVTAQQVVSTYKLQALINLLQKKGIITKNELMKEVDTLRQGK
jgi:uncharacterized Rmd1/YagE family protein